MDQINVAQVITAAAASTLGVLSLIVLVVAFVGFQFFKGSGDRVKVGVWAVMLLAAAAFAVAVVRQSGGTGQAGAPPRPQPSGTPSPEPTADPSPAPAASATPSSEPAATPTDTAAADLSGRWHDDDGFLYDVTVQGGVFAYRQLLDGAAVGTGRGTIAGRKVDYAYVDTRTADSGTCSGRVSRDARRIDGTCTSGGRRWGFAIER